MKLVDDSGWRGARLPELRGDINAATREKLGNVSTEGDSVVGQLQAVQAEDDLQFVEAAGWLYGGFFISQGEGIQLDGAGEILGVKRIGLAQSVARVVYLLDNGQEVAAGDEFTINGIDGDWLVSTPLVATPTRCNGLILAVKETQLIADNVYVISVNGTDYSTVYEDGDTSDSIIGRLYGVITAAELTQTVNDTEYGTLLHVADGYTEANYTFSGLVFDVIKIGEPAQGVYQSDTVFPSVQYGDVISDDILVLSAGITGYLIEDDTSYRRRLQ
ncbi:baseplate protein, partial [Salmonella enterica]|nr:baseplate protein [Salmonella enterica]